ncbi:MAG: hypothetical protein WBY44_30185 [Bryobacteraceae bacterium]
MTRKLTPLETYANAIAQLANAIDEMDQAHALLKEIGCHQLAGPIRRRSIEQVCLDADAALKGIQDLCCDSCGRAVAAHENGDCEEWSN